jgi:hypothetical protein
MDEYFLAINMHEIINSHASELIRQSHVDPVGKSSVDMRRRPFNRQGNEKEHQVEKERNRNTWT